MGNFQGTTLAYAAGEVHLIPGARLGESVWLGGEPAWIAGDEEHDYLGI